MSYLKTHLAVNKKPYEMACGRPVSETIFWCDVAVFSHRGDDRTLCSRCVSAVQREGGFKRTRRRGGAL